MVNHVVTEIEVLCLPADLPEFIAVDLSGLKKGSFAAPGRHQAAQGRDGRDPRQEQPGDRVGRGGRGGS